MPRARNPDGIRSADFIKASNRRTASKGRTHDCTRARRVADFYLAPQQPSAIALTSKAQELEARLERWQQRNPTNRLRRLPLQSDAVVRKQNP